MARAADFAETRETTAQATWSFFGAG
jgi:hypothetical protein